MCNVVYANGFWNDTKQKFSGKPVCLGSWDGNEDDDNIFFYCDGEPVIGNHGDFTITDIEQEA